MHKAWSGTLFLLVVAAILTFPFWYSYSEHADFAAEPIVKPASGECIESADVMRRTHMKILYQWRDEVVRGNSATKRDYVNSKGIHYNKSLTGTCLSCHTSKEEFCDRCHKRVSIQTNCFQCHNTKYEPAAEPAAKRESPHESK